MIYFFHHYELPAILHQAQIQQLLAHTQHQAAGGANGGGANNAPNQSEASTQDNTTNTAESTSEMSEAPADVENVNIPSPSSSNGEFVPMQETGVENSPASHVEDSGATTLQEPEPVLMTSQDVIDSTNQETISLATSGSSSSVFAQLPSSVSDMMLRLRRRGEDILQSRQSSDSLSTVSSAGTNISSIVESVNTVDNAVNLNSQDSQQIPPSNQTVVEDERSQSEDTVLPGETPV